MSSLISKPISGAMYYVKDLEVASKWYTDTLGFSLGDHDFNDFVELTIDRQYVMHLFKSNDDDRVARATFSFATNDIQNTYTVLCDKGVEVSPLHEYSDHSGFTFKDCDGNQLMFCQFYK
ncbi:VOC family protein [Paenibacillus albiflavus]|uniref:VOC family protein n=1 Tax=Paenibacillus albiflavus TaxID=2545760 RepID=A0A4R4EGV0_9BACL|nr:VOC family protein [Paenibacillus albiflavus]TCZ79324.1 VOC family protein [Paenibacillus albiflavus]